MKDSLTETELRAARDWLMDCEWEDISTDEIERISDACIIRAVAAHYCGGLAGFRVDCANF